LSFVSYSCKCGELQCLENFGDGVSIGLYLLNTSLQTWPAARIKTSHGSTWTVVGTNKTCLNAIVAFLLHTQNGRSDQPRQHGMGEIDGKVGWLTWPLNGIT